MTVSGRNVGLVSLGFALGALFVGILVVLAGGPAQPGRSAQSHEDRAEARGAGSPRIGMPIAGVRLADIHNTFNQGRSGGRAHEATDIMKPRGTPVVAVDDGTIVKLFNSRDGGLTVYQFDSGGIYCYYYAHLDRYAEGLAEGMAVKRGDPIGYVGSTGNANVAGPHLHFGITRIGPEKHWWRGQPIDPYPLLIQALKK
jgi:murein DD-endopeptidase MepM/ murein hydrolase activator NlpD